MGSPPPLFEEPERRRLDPSVGWPVAVSESLAQELRAAGPPPLAPVTAAQLLWIEAGIKGLESAEDEE
jgi:hypothetical protein